MKLWELYAGQVFIPERREVGPEYHRPLMMVLKQDSPGLDHGERPASSTFVLILDSGVVAALDNDTNVMLKEKL